MTRFTFYGLQRGQVPYGTIGCTAQPGPSFDHYAAFAASNNFLAEHGREMTEFVRTMCKGKASALKIHDWSVVNTEASKGLTSQFPVVAMFFTSRDDLMLFKIRFADYLLETDTLTGKNVVRPRSDRRI